MYRDVSSAMIAHRPTDLASAAGGRSVTVATEFRSVHVYHQLQSLVSRRLPSRVPTLGETQSKMDVVRFEREQLWIRRLQQAGSHAQVGIDGTSRRSCRNIESCGAE